MGCGDVRLLKTIGSVDFTGQERAALNKLTMPCGAARVGPVATNSIRRGAGALRRAVTGAGTQNSLKLSVMRTPRVRSSTSIDLSSIETIR